MIVLAVALALPAEAAQQGEPKPLQLKNGAAFRHKHSQVEVPATLLDLVRREALEIEPDQLDVMVHHVSADGDLVTVYFYRQVSGGLPIWFDRARASIEQRDDVLPGNALTQAFVPPGQGTASGLAAAYTMRDGRYRSTGLALVPVGEWLVKLRYSSASLDAAALPARMQAVLAAFKWPRKIDPAPAAVAVVPCDTPLALAGASRDAPATEAADPGIMAALLGGALAQLAPDAPDDSNSTVRWCVDTAVGPRGQVYRADSATDAYLVAISDNGTAIGVQPSRVAALFFGSSEDAAAPMWSVELRLGTQVLAYPAQDRLPPPEQAVAIVRDGKPRSGWSTWGEKGEIQIFTDED